MTTVSMLAPTPLSKFTTASSVQYSADAYGLITGVPVGTDVRDLVAAGCVVLGFGISGRNNYTATTDPGVSNDNTQDYAPGSFWLNTTSSRLWMCQSNGTGAATWLLDGVIPGVGVDPSGMLTQFGAAAFGSAFSAFGEEGNLYRNVGNPIASNPANTSDNILDGFVLPASSFDQAKRGLQITLGGAFGATGNNKRFRLWANPTMAGQTVTNGVISGGTVSGVGSGSLLFDSGTQTNNATGWGLLTQLFKYGAGGSNTQFSQSQPIYGTTHGGIGVPAFPTLVESSPINIVITGASLTTGAAGDVLLNWTEVNAMN